MLRVPEERRTVTVLFADLRGLPLDRPESVDAAWRLMREAVEARGGTVDKFVDSTVMAVFGAPAAHDDDPRRALQAALALREAAASFALERGEPVSFAAGVNTGEVLWGSVAGERPTAIGDTVNVAQRLMAEAPEGAILVTRAAERAAGGRFRFGAPDPVRVRGRSQAVEALELLGEARGETGFSARAHELVGREGELAVLEERLRRGRAEFVVLEGEAGAGKSRLAAEFRRRARAAGAWAGVGRALEAARLPFGAFAELIRNEAGAARPDGERLAAWIAADLEPAVEDPVERENAAHLMALSAGMPVPGSRLSGIEPARLRGETQLAWERWLRARAARAPALVCLEDLHHADPGTLDLLAFLASRPRDARLLVVATARPGAAVPAGFERIRVGALAAPAARGLAEAALGGPAEPALFEFLLGQSGGNPLYLEELARWLLEEKALTGPPWRLAAKSARVPGNLQGILTARIDAMRQEDREVLKTASVVGREFWLGLLSRLVGRDAEPAVGEARRTELTAPREASLLPDDREEAFRHALLRDAAYSLVTRKDRARLHALTAGLLEPEAPRAGRKVRLVAAAHREAAGQRDDAARQWMEAAREALEQGEAEEALAHAREARRLAAGPEADLLAAEAALRVSRYAEALEILAGAQAARARVLTSAARLGQGDFAGALADAERALPAAERPGPRADAFLARASALRGLGRFDEALAGAAEGIRALEESAISGLAREDLLRMAGLLRLQGVVHEKRGAYAEAMEADRHALRLYRELGHRIGVANTLNDIGNVLDSRGEFDAALASHEEALGLRRQAGDRAGVAASLNNIGNVHYFRGHAAAAREAYGRALALRREIGDRSGAAMAITNVGHAASLAGDASGALAAHTEALALAREIGDLMSAASALNGMGNALLHLAEMGRALDAYRESLEIRRRVGDPAGTASALQNIGNVHGRKGEWEEASRAMQESLAIRRRIGDRAGTSSTLLNLACVRLVSADLGAAVDLLRESDVMRREMAIETGADETAELLALALFRLGRAAEAKAVLAGAPPGVADSQVASEIAAGEGDSAVADRRLDGAVARYESDQQVDALTGALCLRAARRLRPDPASARADLDRAAGFASKHGGRAREALALTLLARLDAAQGDPAAARARLARAAALEPHRHDLLAALDVYAARAEAFLELGEAAPAREAAEEGLRVAREKGLAGVVPAFEGLLKRIPGSGGGGY